MKPMLHITLVISVAAVFTSTASATTPEDYLVAGRSALFDGSVDGARSAHSIFDSGIKDPACPACSSDRELHFFRALTGAVMVVVRDDGGSTDSMLELARLFDLTMTGTYWSTYMDPEGLGMVASSIMCKIDFMPS
jgi:hypothetical protein